MSDLERLQATEGRGACPPFGTPLFHRLDHAQRRWEAGRLTSSETATLTGLGYTATRKSPLIAREKAT